jgi:hypothetical protein
MGPAAVTGVAGNDGFEVCVCRHGACRNLRLVSSCSFLEFVVSCGGCVVLLYVFGEEVVGGFW